ncbi:MULTISPECIES: hypothetical protein [Microcoleaceae]|nr:hypothetical protein [Lyngbya sp. CCAP 1446/10]
MLDIALTEAGKIAEALKPIIKLFSCLKVFAGLFMGVSLLV